MVILLTLIWSLLANTRGPAQEGVLSHLTQETVETAAACGRSGAECVVAPYQLCPSETPRRYEAQIATPFSRVAAAAFEAQASGKRFRPIEPAAVNRWGVGIYVFPAERSEAAEAIVRVEIRRDGKVFQPKTTTVGPIATQMPDGSTRQLARGFFRLLEKPSRRRRI